MKDRHAWLAGGLAILVAGAIWLFAPRTDDPPTPEIEVYTKLWLGFTDPDMTGLYWETLLAVFEPAGITINPTLTTYEESVNAVQSKQADIALGFYADAYDGVLYPRWPQEVDSVVVVFPAGQSFTGDQSLIGKTSAWIGSYQFERYLPDGIDYVQLESEAEGLRLLDAGEIDYLIDYESNMELVAEQSGMDLSHFDTHRVDALKRLVFPVFRDDERGQAIMSIYDKRMAELYESGELGSIFSRYNQQGIPVPANLSDQSRQ